MSTLSRFAVVVAAGLITSVTACGKKGPPLPPLIRVPAAPQALVAHRQGSRVLLRLHVPGNNIDGSRPGDVARVEVFAMNGVGSVTPDDIVRRGVRIGSVKVNPPPDPDEEETDEPAQPKPPTDGIDQGAEAIVTDTLAADLAPDALRSYVAVAFSPRGRRGALSNVVAIPLVVSPPPPSGLTIAYDATTATVSWPASADDALPVHLYDVTTEERRLSDAPISDGRFVDRQLVFDVERCYAARAIATVGGASVESDPSARACVTPRDTFPPDAPTGLNAVPETGAISLIWNPVDAADLAGYIVLRTTPTSTTPVAVNETPLADTTFRDTVVAGVRMRYMIVAVDKSGNRSEPSPAIEETAR